MTGAWFEVTVTGGPAAGHETDPEDIPYSLLESGAGSVVTIGAGTYVAYVPGDALASFSDAARGRGFEPGRAVPVDPSRGSDVPGPVDVGRFVVVPVAAETTPETRPGVPGRTVVAVLSGTGFGTGHHETTRTLLGEISRIFEGPFGGEPGARVSGRSAAGSRSVLDVGTGSGVLAVAAALSGAGEVVATDTDPLALDNAAANVRMNGVGDRVTLVEGSFPGPGRTFDLVFANLYAEVLVVLSERLAASLRPGGTLLVSGVLPGLWPDVSDALGKTLRLVRHFPGESWTSARFEREAR